MVTGFDLLCGVLAGASMLAVSVALCLGLSTRPSETSETSVTIVTSEPMTTVVQEQRVWRPIVHPAGEVEVAHAKIMC